jgi:hypothetical protein
LQSGIVPPEVDLKTTKWFLRAVSHLSMYSNLKWVAWRRHGRWENPVV